MVFVFFDFIQCKTLSHYKTKNRPVGRFEEIAGLNASSCSESNVVAHQSDQHRKSGTGYDR